MEQVVVTYVIGFRKSIRKFCHKKVLINTFIDFSTNNVSFTKCVCEGMGGVGGGALIFI